MRKESDKLSQPESKKRLRDKLCEKWAAFRNWLRLQYHDPCFELSLQYVAECLRTPDIRLTLHVEPGGQLKQLRQIMPRRLIVAISPSDLVEHTYFEAKPVESESRKTELLSGEATCNVALLRGAALRWPWCQLGRV